MSGAQQVTFMNQRSFGPPPGQEAFTTAGTFTFVVPAGVTRVSAVVVGGGVNNGGALAYKNNITVDPATSYNVQVGCGAFGGTVRSFFINACTVQAQSGCSRTGDGGGDSGGGSFGGGGAGGYSGNGGSGGTSPTAGSGGGGGGGKATFVFDACCNFIAQGGGGGGVGILGEGTSGAAGTGNFGGGGGGSGGASGGTPTTFPPAESPGSGGAFGGGRGAGTSPCSGSDFGTPSNGAVRIIFPGCARSFPSTRTGNE